VHFANILSIGTRATGCCGRLLKVSIVANGICDSSWFYPVEQNLVSPELSPRPNFSRQYH
jgi:hypothetical protein